MSINIKRNSIPGGVIIHMNSDTLAANLALLQAVVYAIREKIDDMDQSNIPEKDFESYLGFSDKMEEVESLVDDVDSWVEDETNEMKFFFENE